MLSRIETNTLKNLLTSVSSNTGLSLDSNVLSVFELGFKLPASIHNFFQSPSVKIDLFSAKQTKQKRFEEKREFFFCSYIRKRIIQRTFFSLFLIKFVSLTQHATKQLIFFMLPLNISYVFFCIFFQSFFAATKCLNLSKSKCNTENGLFCGSNKLSVLFCFFIFLSCTVFCFQCVNDLGSFQFFYLKVIELLFSYLFSLTKKDVFFRKHTEKKKI